MKKLIIISASFFALIGCNNSSSVESETNELTIAQMKGKRSDNVYFDYKFGMSLDAVNKHSEELFKQGKISELVDHEFEIEMTNSILTLTGYDSKFSINDYSCNALITPKFFNDKLSRLEIVLMDFPEGTDSDKILSDVTKLFESKYGKSTKPSKFVSKDDIENIRYYTQDSNKAIYISQVLGFVTIVYADLISQDSENKDSNAQIEATNQSTSESI